MKRTLAGLAAATLLPAGIVAALATPAAAAPAAPAPAAAAPAAPAAVAAAVSAEPIDPYKYALAVDAPAESSVWRANIMTIVTLLVLWGLVILVYSLLVVFQVLPVPGAA